MDNAVLDQLVATTEGVGEDVRSLKTDAEQRKAEIAELRAEFASKNAAKAGEAVSSGRFRGQTAGTLATAIRLANERKNEAVDFDGFEQTRDGLVVSGKDGVDMVRQLEDLVGRRIGTVDGETRVLTTSDVSAVMSEAVDAEVWQRARDRGAIWTYFRSPSGEVRHATKAAIQGETLYCQPKAQNANYALDNRSPVSTQRNMNTIAIASQFSPEGLFDADLNLIALRTQEMMDGIGDSFDNIILNADNRKTGNVNADGQTLPTNVTANVSAITIADNVAGLRTRCLTDANRSTNVAKALDLSTLSALVNTLPSDRPKLIVTNRNTAAALMGVSEIARVADFGNLAALVNGVPTSIYGHQLLVSDQLPLVAADGKVTRGTDGVVSGSTAGSIVVVDPAYYELAFGSRPAISTDNIVASGNIQLAIRSTISFVGFNDGGGYVGTGTITSDSGSYYGYNITI